ncbi:PREDICTED: uncharacterized protein LOC108779997 [Cyphomyrmex costatus]|uniref:uncharacterized protein LOC108779997 n=1 Tax=Cyphomyrmex costatus TaxID=456900 RepID=UPI000852323C|nr:PREDICTED: uncharacterized protein LOC108779997 [Cyphomyrmex costatus]
MRFRLNKQSVRLILEEIREELEFFTNRVSQAIIRLRPRYIHFPTTEQEIRKEQLQFYNIARFPRVIGCIDYIHVRVQSFGMRYQLRRVMTIIIATAVLHNIARQNDDVEPDIDPDLNLPAPWDHMLTACNVATSSCLDGSSVPSSPALPSTSNAKKRRARSISVEPQNTKQIHEADKFDNLFNEFIQPRSEEQAFCSFLQSRLERLQKKYYMRITHMILQEVMKIELEQSESQYLYD